MITVLKILTHGFFGFSFFALILALFDPTHIAGKDGYVLTSIIVGLFIVLIWGGTISALDWFKQRVKA